MQQSTHLSVLICYYKCNFCKDGRGRGGSSCGDGGRGGGGGGGSGVSGGNFSRGIKKTHLLRKRSKLKTKIAFSQEP